MKKALKIIGIIIISLAVIFAALTVINRINEREMNAYIDTFGKLEAPLLTPSYDSDGVAYFTTDRDFRVMQLTDIHIGGGFLSTKTDKQTINAVAAMIAEEKPDLVIVTGDISFAVPYIAGTVNNAYAHSMFIRLMERLGVYWTATFGNHDSEAYNFYARQTVGDMYSADGLEYSLFSDCGGISGVGNHVINVKNSKGFVTESFYMIDTHAYTERDPLGIMWDYDYVKDDQISWYADSVRKYNAENLAIYNALDTDEQSQYSELLCAKSLMFMHIPLREVKYAYGDYVNNSRQNTPNTQYIEGNDGETDEIVFSSRTDTALFDTALALGSTQAMFFGHDHLNNFVLKYKGIVLSYGYSLDYLAYSGIAEKGYQRGCTVITCSPNGDAAIVHENYYQDKYEPLYEKESVDMTK